MVGEDIKALPIHVLQDFFLILILQLLFILSMTQCAFRLVGLSSRQEYDME